MTKKTKKKQKKKKKIATEKINKVEILKQVKSEPILDNLTEKKKTRKLRKNFPEIESLEKRVGIIEQSRRRSLAPENKTFESEKSKEEKDKEQQTKLLEMNQFSFPGVFKSRAGKVKNYKTGLMGHINNNYRTYFDGSNGFTGSRLMLGKEKGLIKGTIPEKRSDNTSKLTRNEPRVLEFIG